MLMGCLLLHQTLLLYVVYNSLIGHFSWWFCYGYSCLIATWDPHIWYEILYFLHAHPNSQNILVQNFSMYYCENPFEEMFYSYSDFSFLQYNICLLKLVSMYCLMCILTSTGFIQLVWVWRLNKQKSWNTFSALIVQLKMLLRNLWNLFLYHQILNLRWENGFSSHDVSLNVLS